jgi:MFS family permease
MKLRLKFMLLLEAFFMLAGGLFNPLYALFVEQIGGTIIDVGIAASLFLVSTGVMIFFIGRWEDKFKHQEKLYMLGFLIAGVGYLAHSLVTTRFELFAVQIFLGVAVAIYTPVRDSLYTKFIDKGREASEWAGWEAENYIVPAIAAIVGATVVAEFGFQTLFFLMFAIAMVGFFVGLNFFHKSRAGRRKTSRKRKKKL